MLRYLVAFVIGMTLFQVAAPARAASQVCWGVGGDKGGVDAQTGVVHVNHDVTCFTSGDTPNSGGGGNAFGGSSGGPSGGGGLQTSTNTTTTPEKKNFKAPPCLRVGDPIDPASGTKVDAVTDFAMPGEMGLSFSRYYVSRNGHGQTPGRRRCRNWRDNL